MTRNILLAAAVAALELCTALPAFAQNLIVGRSLPLTGHLKSIGEFKRDGGDAYIHKVNASGGIGGKKIEVITLDDGYVGETTIANLKKINSEQKPIAFLGLLRLPTNGTALPLLNELKVPFVGISSATDALRAEYNPYGFPVRAGFAEEARKLVNHVKVTSLNRVSLIYQDVPLGKNIKLHVEAAAKEASLESVTHELDGPGSRIAEVARAVVQDKPQAIFLGTLAPAAVALIAELRKIPFNGAIYTFSSTEASMVSKQLGKQAVGIAISQIVPIPNGPRVKVVAEYLQAMKELGKGSVSLLGLEAFIEAKVLVEGLRRAGPKASPATLVSALETIRNFDLGGFFVSYSPQAHTGSLYVEVNVINARGELIR